MLSSATWIPIAIWLSASAGILAGADLLLDSRRDAAHDETLLLTEQATLRLEDLVRSRLLVVEFVRKEVSAGQIRDRATFEARTARLQEEFDGFQAINWIDAQGVIRWVSPPGPNREALAHDVRETLARDAFDAARRTGQPRLTGPLVLIQGGRGFTSYFPVLEADGSVRGYVNGVFRVQPLVEQSFGAGILDAYVVHIRDGDAAVYGDPERFAEEARDRVRSEVEVSLLGRTWLVCLTPRLATWKRMAGTRERAYTGIALLLTAALALATRLALRRREQREQAIDARRRLETQLHHSQKMEALGQLAGGVAHDFNNLLTTMMGNADLVRGADGLEKAEREALEQIVLASERASQLTSQLLTFSRKQIAQPQPLDANAEIEVLRPILERLLRENVVLELDLADDLGIVEMDVGQFGQILINLLVNAVDAMPEGGRVVVSTRHDPGPREGQPGPWDVIAVEDTGHGMDAETLKRAFEPFFTTKPPGRGTGLGLSTVYGVATSAGGLLDASSEPGRGTRVEVALPSTRGLQRQPPAPARGPLRYRRGVLVVEDEPAVRRVAGRLLEQAGFEVVEAENGRDALERVAAGARFDVVVTDAVMPEMGGVALLRALRDAGAEFAAVVCSGYAQEIAPEDLAALDAIFLPKPYAADTLLQALDRAVARIEAERHRPAARDGAPRGPRDGQTR